jgi:hypothetical protein
VRRRLGQVYVAYEPHTAGGLTHALLASRDFGRRFVYEGSLGPVPELLAPSQRVRPPSGPMLECYGDSATLAYAAPRPGSPSPTIYAAQSLNTGALTKPAAVTTVPASAAAFQPAITAEPDGSLDLSYYALRSGTVQVLLTRSRDNGSDWSASTPISRPFNPDHGLRVAFGTTGNKRTAPSFWWLGDWQGLSRAGTTLHAIWDDTRTGSLQLFTTSIASSQTPASVQARHSMR